MICVRVRGGTLSGVLSVIGKERELKSRTKVMGLNVSRKMTICERNQ